MRIIRNSTGKNKQKLKIASIREGVLYSELIADSVPYAKFMELCSYQPPGYQFMKKYKQQVWDGRIRLARKRPYGGGYSFPTGLINRVTNFLDALGYNVKIERTYKVKKHSLSTSLKKTKLRKYQIEGIKAALKKQRGIIKLPTGSGKTKLAAGLILSIKRPTIFLVGKKDLLYQTADVFSEEIGKKWIGIVGDGNRSINVITVATVQTLDKNPQILKTLQSDRYLLIVDEIHHSRSNSWYNVITSLPCIYRIGLTATPLEQTNEQILLEAAIGPVIYEKKVTKMIKEGWLSKPTIFIIDLVDIDKLPERYNYFKAYSKGIKNAKRNDFIVQISKILKKEGKTPIVISLREIDHLKSLQKQFDETNLKVISLHGSDKATIRQRYFKLTNRKKIDVLLISTIFDEGIDIPNIKTLIFAGGGKSQVKTIQRLGRGMRKTKTKKDVLVIDFYDRAHDYIERHSRKRIAIYKSEGHKVFIMTFKEFKKRIKKL